MPYGVESILKSKLLALMGLRVVVALVFVGIPAFFQLIEYSPLKPSFYSLHVIAGAIAFLSISYAFLLGSVRNLKFLAYAQIAVDVMLITGTIYVMGAIESYLSVLYSLSVISGAILLSRRGGYYAAALSSAAYGILLLFDFYGLLPNEYKIIFSGSIPRWKDILTSVSINVLGLHTIAYLTGYLAEKTARAERQLEEKEIDLERLENLNKLIVDNITSGILTLDASSRITSFNHAATLITGYTLKDVYYRDVESLFPNLVGQLKAQSGKERPERTVKRKDGADVALGFTVSEGKDEEMKTVVIFQDLTAIKAMEEQLRRDDRLRALGSLSVAIAHEVRNPLASISGSIQVLKDDADLKGDKKSLMEIVLRETERLNRLITDFLLFAKPAREKLEVFDVSTVIRETLEVFANSPDVELSSIVIENSLHDDLFIEGNRRQIFQVFWNLFINAAHSMPGGGRLKVIAGPKESNAMEIEVKDTGVGICAENISKIFDPFFSTKESGTGLGLSLVYKIVEAHGGTIDVKSGVGQGTVFKMKFPIYTKGAVGA